MRLVILSVDYEIFGNGTGDVRQHITEPGGHMARLCHKYGMPLTVFFEVEEYLAFVKYAAELKRDLGYDPAELIREQIASFLRDGHDVQLHLHPEWYGARYENSRWILNPARKTVDSLFESAAEVADYIAARKSVIEEIGGNPGHRVRAYRAGAFSAQPGEKLLSALQANGIKIDTSVVKGLCSATQGYDYRQAPSAKGPWPVRGDVAVADRNGPVWEFPIYSVMGRRLHQFTFTRLRAKFSRNVPKNKQKEMMNQLGIRPGNPFGLIKFLWQKVPIKLDYHNVSAYKILRWIRSAPPAAEGQPDVVMLIGHTKEHIDNEAFEELLLAICQEPDTKVISLATLAGLLKEENPYSPLNCR